jgi:hypothetical protein
VVLTVEADNAEDAQRLAEQLLPAKQALVLLEVAPTGLRF